MANRKVDQAAVDRAKARVDAGESWAAAAAAEGMSEQTLRNRTKLRLAPPAPAPTPPVNALSIDVEGTPLELARSLIARASADLGAMAADSPRRNPAIAQLRGLTRMLADLERASAAKETPEEVERRRRREDGETLKMILWSVERAEKEAAKRGVCIHCGSKLVRGI